MIDSRHVDEFFTRCKAIFLERNRLYGTAGMDVEKCLSLLSTKVDRMRNIKDPGQIHDSTFDAANYALIAFLLATDQWKDSGSQGMSERKENTTEGQGDPKKRTILVKGREGGIHHPKREGDVGFDLECSDDFILPPHGNANTAFIIPTGVNIKIPDGYYCQIVGRSSASKKGIGVQTAIIDTGYTGPMFACCWNMTDKDILVKKGDRIAQAVFAPVCVFDIEYVDELPETERGDKGFGSTGA